MLYYFIPYLISTVLLFLLSKKWCLPIRKTIFIIVLSLLFSSISIYLLELALNPVIVMKIIIMIGFAIFFYILIIIYLFYRNPERYPPDGNNIIVSPADGKVIYITRTEASEIISVKKENRILINEVDGIVDMNEKYIHIGISMVFTDVHINRSPINGKAKFIKHTPGKFLSLKNKDSLSENERQTIVIGNEYMDLVIVQIASRLVRRIVSYIKDGQNVDIGDRIGMIKFGSQVDILIPENKVKELKIKLNDDLVAGETVIAGY